MLRTCLSAVVALLLVAGVSLAADKAEKKPPQGKRAFGTLVKCDLAKGTICLMVRKNRDDQEGTKTEFKVTDDTKFLEGQGRGQKPMTLTKDEFKSKVKEGNMVAVMLDEDGKTAKSVVLFKGRGGRNRPKKDSK